MKNLALISAIFAVVALTTSSRADDNQTLTPSYCQAIASNEAPLGWPGQTHASAMPLLKASASATPAQTVSPGDVSITYVGHSTFRIETSSSLTIATDFSGFAGLDVIPEVVTMNHAHSTHFTIAPDPRIEHVFRGWGANGNPARHHQQIADALIRNVTTDINNQWAGFEPDGNSIFIFEIAGLCIGHLGHLHHLPTDTQYAEIGRLDVLMVPVDGGYTLNVKDMSDVVRRVNASLILPMHWFGTWSLGSFLDEIRNGFPVQTLQGSQMTVSLNTLPDQPTVVVLQPESILGNGGTNFD